MPDCLVKASSVGRDFSSSETSMYWVQLDQLMTLSVSLRSLAAAAVGAAEPDGFEAVPSLPQALRAAVAPRPSAPLTRARRLVRPRSSAARMIGDIWSGVGRSAIGFSSRGGAQGLGVSVQGVVCRACFGSAHGGSGLDVGHDVLDAGVVLEAVH